MEIRALLAGVCLCGAMAGAQTRSATEETTIEHRVETRAYAAQPLPPQAGVAAQAATFHFIGAGVGMEGKVVKNAPYSAEGVTETTRALADGTKITQKTPSKVYRDTEGRTRREQTLTAIGEWSSAGEPPTTVSVSDPVAGEVYILNPKEKSAQKIKVDVDERIERAGRVMATQGAFTAATETFDVAIPAPANVKHMARGSIMASGGPHVMFLGGDGDSKEEALGERNLEGVMAKGTRVTTTIPVGRIGNDRPIMIVHESWFSPDLQVMVLSETKDPMAGDITYRLTNIQRSNPPASLFEIPPDFKVEQGGMIHRKIHVRETKEKE